MGNIKDLFVSYEIAKQLKEKEMLVQCFGFFNKDNNNQLEFYDVPMYGAGYNTPAPTYQQVVDWLRESKNIDISLFSYGKYWVSRVGMKQIEGTKDGLTTYYEALIKAIEEAIKLI